MKLYLKMASLFFILTSTVYAESISYLESIAPATDSNMGSNFSFETGELDVPAVIVDGDTLYDVKLRLINTENGMIFSLVEAVGLPSFEERFGAIENNMSKKEVKKILGMPQDMRFNLEIKVGAFCSEPQLALGSVYEEWRYFVDPQSQGPSGFVVWFAKVEGGSEESVVVGYTKGFSCI